MRATFTIQGCDHITALSDMYWCALKLLEKIRDDRLWSSPHTSKWVVDDYLGAITFDHYHRGAKALKKIAEHMIKWKDTTGVLPSFNVCDKPVERYLCKLRNMYRHQLNLDLMSLFHADGDMMVEYKTRCSLAKDATEALDKGDDGHLDWVLDLRSKEIVLTMAECK